MKQYPHLSGLIAAPFTPMNEDRTINLDMIERQVQLFVENGVKGAFVCGTTGESMSLTMQERIDIAERWQQISSNELTVIVHVGHTCLSDAKKLAAHAQQIGAYAIGAMAPCFYKPDNIESLVSFCAEIASAAPELPFYYYHIPSMTGVNFLMSDFLKRAINNLPTLAGIKFTYENLMDFNQCLNFENGRFDMLFGRDEILITGLALGANGAVGSTYNYASPLYNKLIQAYKSGDIATAQKEQKHSQDIVNILHKFGGLPAGKAIMKITGLDCGGVRSPLQNLSKDEYEEVENYLEKIGFFDFCSKIY